MPAAVYSFTFSLTVAAMSSATKMIEIQKKLEMLKDQRQREQTLFDSLAAAHPELSAAQIQELAVQEAVKAIPQSLTIGTVKLSVGDVVGVKDDSALLARADRGHFAVDPLKRVYLGERGEVEVVLPSFQGKPAVELRFADGNTKMFFAECLDLGPSASAAVVAAVERRTLKCPDPEETPVAIPEVRVPLPQKAVPLPGWGDLRMPHRRQSSATVSMTDSVTHGALVAGTASHMSSSMKDADHGLAPREQDRSPSMSMVTKAPEKMPPTSYTEPMALEKLPSPSSNCGRAPRSPTPSFNREASVPSASTAPQRAYSVGLVKEAISSNCIMHPSSPQDSLGLPLPQKMVPPIFGERLDARQGRYHDLRATPRGDYLATSGTHHSGLPTRVVPVPERESQVPKMCPASYSPKFHLNDRSSKIPHRRSIATRRCWVAGYAAGSAAPLAYSAISIDDDDDSLEGLLSLVTEKLEWDGADAEPATRLFKEDGSEVMWPSVVLSGMRVIATSGCTYAPPSKKTERVVSLPTGNERNSPPPARSEEGPKLSKVPLAYSRALPVPPAPVRRKSAPTSSGLQRSKNAKPLSSTSAASSLGGTKPIHIMVFENGIYDDNIYRTVTVRPTYKTLSALKSLIGRELRWRDGRRVDVLYDASGMEIEEISELFDGEAVVASGGDRFIIPYPNTALHREAMKLSERML